METVRLENVGAVAEIILDNPGKHNAMSAQAWARLEQITQEIENSDARAVLLRGEGGVFSAGHDLGSIHPTTTDAFHVVNDQVNPPLRALRRLSIPTIAAVSGICMGGGLCLAAACDMIVCSENARMGVPYSGVGFVSDGGTHVFLRDALGHHQASYLMYTAKILSGRDAFNMGLCCEVHNNDALLDAARGLATRLANGPTAAFRETKAILLSGADMDTSLDMEAHAQARIFKTVDAAEGVDAFGEKRAPKFIGK